MGAHDGSPSPGRGRGCEWKAGWSPSHSGPGPHALVPTGAKAWPMRLSSCVHQFHGPAESLLHEFCARPREPTLGLRLHVPPPPASMPSGSHSREVTAVIIKSRRGRGEWPQRLCPPGAVSILAGGSCPQDKPRAAASTSRAYRPGPHRPFTLEPGGRLARRQAAGLIRVRPGPQAWGRVCGLDAGSRFRVALPPSLCSATCTAGSERQGGRSSRCSCRGTTVGRVQSP